MTHTFYSNGKLLLTGEYVVLDGAEALAVPTKLGQSLTVSKGKGNKIQWKSFDSDDSIWFEDIFSFEEIISKLISETNSSIKNKLIEILHQAYKQNPSFLNIENGYIIETKLTFPRIWGLGTSSTLINNIAQWLKIDAFELLQKSFGGSGYDIACAQENSPIVYQLVDNKPLTKKVNFSPSFKENIYFVYLNKKQNSSNAISGYISKQHKAASVLNQINRLTHEVLICNNVKDFSILLEKHESIISQVLETQTIKELLFNDFSGAIKSLGAWGGDFIMVVSNSNPKNYFTQKGYEIIIPYKKLIL